MDVDDEFEHKLSFSFSLTLDSRSTDMRQPDKHFV